MKAFLLFPAMTHGTPSSDQQLEQGVLMTSETPEGYQGTFWTANGLSSYVVTVRRERIGIDFFESRSEATLARNQRLLEIQLQRLREELSNRQTTP